jgi:hypothetical protein
MSGADVAMKYAAYPDRLRGAPWWRCIGRALAVVRASSEGEALMEAHRVLGLAYDRAFPLWVRRITWWRPW